MDTGGFETLSSFIIFCKCSVYKPKFETFQNTCVTNEWCLADIKFITMFEKWFPFLFVNKFQFLIIKRIGR